MDGPLQLLPLFLSDIIILAFCHRCALLPFSTTPLQNRLTTTVIWCRRLFHLDDQLDSLVDPGKLITDGPNPNLALPVPVASPAAAGTLQIGGTTSVNLEQIPQNCSKSNRLLFISDIDVQEH